MGKLNCRNELLYFLLCAERVLKLMDYEQGAFQDYTGHHDTVGCIAFSPCGKFLVSTSQSIIHFWNVILQ
jgi:WD40 repeat protein